MIEINVELLLGRKVVDAKGERVGRIEELLVERGDNACLVEAYLVGASALVDRLSAWSLVRPIRKFLHGRSVISSYRIPWQEMDLTDPEQPRLRVERSELRHAN